MTQKKIHILNRIASAGTDEFPAENYLVGAPLDQADAVLVRSADMHKLALPDKLLAVGRAGAGTNNIPTQELSGRGVPVFNAPGANANAVKELVLGAMLMTARNLPAAIEFTNGLDRNAADLELQVETGKKTFAGFELTGKTLGIVGLGRIGCLVADAAIALGMKVVGHDPSITVDAAWSLPSQVRKAGDLDSLLRQCDFVSLHVPLVDSTRRMVNESALENIKQGAVLINFSRAGVVDEQAVKDALNAGTLTRYLCDFPSAATLGHEQILSLPHLGASTTEAEENCALMVAQNLRDYLEHGNIAHSVNFPAVSMPRESDYRVAIANANVPNMLGQISTVMANASLNIRNMINKSRGEVAYTLVDVDSPILASVIETLEGIDGVLKVRALPLGS